MISQSRLAACCRGQDRCATGQQITGETTHNHSLARTSGANTRTPNVSTHTIPFRSSSSGYFVPRQTMPSFHNVRIIERSSV
jgi:hypothetical protein